jgi:hypothetical protein
MAYRTAIAHLTILFHTRAPTMMANFVTSMCAMPTLSVMEGLVTCSHVLWPTTRFLASANFCSNSHPYLATERAHHAAPSSFVQSVAQYWLALLIQNISEDDTEVTTPRALQHQHQHMQASLGTHHLATSRELTKRESVRGRIFCTLQGSLERPTEKGLGRFWDTLSIEHLGKLRLSSWAVSASHTAAQTRGLNYARCCHPRRPQCSSNRTQVLTGWSDAGGTHTAFVATRLGGAG